jgi:hypothetical protein
MNFPGIYFVLVTVWTYENFEQRYYTIADGIDILQLVLPSLSTILSCLSATACIPSE